MIKLIVGLGNPTPQYHRTRHNIGFVFLQKLADEAGVAFAAKTAWQGEVATAGGRRLLRPLNYMNNSGFAVGAVLRYFGVAANEMLVVHDEVDFAAGDIRLKFGGGEAGHNGLRDISRVIGDKDYWRLRIGVGETAEDDSTVKNNRPQKTADFVLQPPNQKEREKIDGAMNRALSVWADIANGDMEKVMLLLHTAGDKRRQSNIGETKEAE